MKTIIKDVQGLVASLLSSIHRVAVPSHRRLRLSLLTLILTLGTGQMWGEDIAQNAQIYFDNSVSNWSYNSTYFVINDKNGYKMSAIDRSKLYYHKRTAGTWSGYSGIRLFAAASSWGDNDVDMSNYKNMYDNCSNLSNWYNASYGFGSSGYHFIKLDKTGSKDSQANISVTYNGTKPTLTSTAKIRTRNSYDNSYSTVSTGTWPATVNMEGTYWSGDNASGHNNAATNSGASGTYTNMYTGLVEMSVSSLSDQYTFDGWATSEASSPANTDATYSYYITNNTTVYAYFTKKWTISFDLNGRGSSTPSTQYVAEGGKVSSVSNPSAIGYTFGGWYTNEDCTGSAWNFSSSTVSEDITLYAKWTEITITDVTVSPSTGGTGNIPMTVSFKTNVPRSSGYYYRIAEFGGSGTGSVGGGFYINGQVITSGDASTLITTSPFTPNFGSSGVYTAAIQVYTDGPVVVQKTYYFTYGAGNYYTVSFNMNGHGSSISSQSVLSGGTATRPSPDPTTTGYTFDGWYQESTCTNIWDFSTAITADRILYAKWTPKTTTVTLDRQSGTGGSASVTATYDADMPSATMPTRANYNFAGYYSGTGGTGTKYYNADGTSAHTWDFEDATKTLYAYWTEKTHTVSVQVATGQDSWGIVSPASVNAGEVNYLTDITATAHETKGYYFVNWTATDGITIQDATNRITRVIADRDGTLTANFEGRNRETDIYLTGTMNSWATSGDAWRFVKLPGEEGNTVSLTKTINRGDYSSASYAIEFKIYHSKWDTKYWTNAENATKMNAGNCTNWSMNVGTGEGNNTAVDLSVSGDYTFTLTDSENSSGQRLTVTYPDKSFLEGAFNSWSETANLLVDDGTTQRCTINIASVGDYEFRLVSHSVAYKNSTKFERTGNTKTLTAMNMTETPASFNAPVPGNYIFTFNTSNKSLTITYPTGNYLRGGFNSWGWDIPLTATGNANEYAATVSLTGEQAEHLFSGEDGFKVVYDGVHYGKNSATIDGNNRTASSLSTSGGNIALATAYPGTYTFTFNSSSNNLTVDYPDIPDMSGTLDFNLSQTGKVCGTGTNESPFLVFQGETLTLRATHNSPPATAADHIYYQYTVNSVVQTAKQGDLTFAPTTSSTTGNIPFTVQAFYQYGPENHKVQGTPVPSTTYYYYYKVIPRPTVTISSITSQVEVDKEFTFDIATTNTDVSCLSGYGPWFTRQYQKWNGSSWGAWTDADATPTTDASTLAMANEGFYQWRIKMNYGGTNSTGGSVFYSNIVQNVIYKPCQVTITTSGSAVGWFKGVYAYRETDDFESLCSHHNGTYPGEYFKNSCVEAGDNTWIYIFKYPIYTHIILNNNTSSTANRTDAIPITQKTCINITGQKFQDTNNWAFTKTENCGDVYYRVLTTYTPNSTTYYSNIVKKGSAAPLSFFAAASGSGTLTWQKLENGVWSNQSTLTSPPQSGVYQADYNGDAGISGITQYLGKLYIRTDAAAGGWEEYINEDNEMNHFTPRSNYDYYWVTYTGDNIDRNIDAEIGNTINKCLARRIEDRNVYADAEGKVNEKNVRFSYDSQNNWFDYAVIGASTNTSYTFLSTYGADAQGATTSTKVFKLTDSQEKGTATKENDPNNQVKFSDLSNWVYQADVWAEADGSNAVTIAIEARLPGIATVQQIVDRAQPLTTLGATTTAGSYIIRILYDYKTNTITTGWLPKDNTSITTPTTIAGNMILNRGETTSVEQLTLSNGVTVSGLRKLYMALKLDKSNLTNGEPYSSSYIHYIWFSLPYDCQVSDIFGAPGEYPDDWEIWEYDGAKRAREGLLDDASFFKTVPFNGTLEANKGYCLGLLLNENRFKTIVMDDVARSSIYIYFPSEVDGYTLQNSATKQLVVPAQYDETFFTRRPDREKYDRDWNLMGVPSYNDITAGISATDQGVEHTHEAASAPGFIYDYAYTGGTAGSSENNKYKYIAVNSNAVGFKYKAFFSYMMQYAGTITWTSNSIENIHAAPRKPVRTGEHQLTQATLNLQLLANDEWLDNTFVSLLPRATDKVDHNIDLVKIWNSGSSQLCSLSEDVELAANCLSVDSQTVDLRVYIDNTRTYTFRLEEKVPDGLIALLEDTEAHTLTDLGSDAYTVDLMQGTYDARFRLHLIVGRSDIGTDIDQLTNSMSYTLYGNELLLNALTEPVRAALYDPAGRLLYQGTVNPGNTINLPDQAGVYLLRLPTQTLRIVK